MKDIHIREELHKNYLSSLSYDSDTRIFNELGLCEGAIKIDVAVINGSLIGYEIKSEQDTLKRLPAQMEVYNKIFDYINIVVNNKHLDKIKNIIPEYWGIIEVIKYDTDFKLDVHRKPSKNINSESYHIVQLLWKDEALELLASKDLSKGMKSKKRTDIWKKIVENFSKDDINREVRTRLKNRANWKSADL